VWLRPRSLTQIFELFFCHVLRHMVVKNVINIFLVLRKQTKEIGIFSNCLTRQFELIFTQIQTITIGMPSTNVIGFTLILFLKQEVIKYHQIFILRGDFFWVWNIVCRFIKITLNWLFGTSLLIFCQLMNKPVW